MRLRAPVGGKPIDYRGNAVGYVYFAQVGSSGLVKIGFSVDVVRRLRTLRCGHPTPLRLLGGFRGTIHDEQRWHRNMADLRRHGEWFSPHEFLMSRISVAILNGGLTASEIVNESRPIPGQTEPKRVCR